MEGINCSMCSFKTRSQAHLMQHTVRNHRFDRSFVAHCQHEGCGMSYHSWNSFKSHTYTKHRVVAQVLGLPEGNIYPVVGHGNNTDLLENNNVHDNDNEPQELCGQQAIVGLPDILSRDERKQWNAVKFIQNLREGANISQVAMNKVVEGVGYLYEEQQQLLKDDLLNGGDLNGLVTSEHIKEVLKDNNNLFQGVQTRFLVDKFLIEHRQLVMPERVVLGKYWAWKYKPTTKLVELEHTFYNIPFISSLSQLLCQEDVMHCIDNPKPFRENGYLANYTDGYYCNSHPFFKRRINDEQSLMIIVYYDDIEICNPLGSKSKIHKLGMFYWTLGNVYPEFRSSLRAVNLLAISKTVYIRKYGVNKILEPFIQNIKQLESAEGLSIRVNGTLKTFRGTILFFTGDTLASNYVGGFKEGVAFAKRPCRVCLAKRDELSKSFIESDFELRNAQSHIDYCDTIEEPNLSKEAKAFWSKTYGINERSVLCQLEYFDITKCLVQDLMHVAIEGVLELEIRLFIKYCLDQKFLTLSYINMRITDFDYGHLSKNKPSRIDPQHLENKLRQNAAQTMTLGNILPFITMSRCPHDEPKLKNLIVLLQIINLMLAFKIKENDVILLKKMIEIHHNSFLELYPERPPTPKFHFFIHLPEQILRFGPLRQQWCMRFEAAHCRAKGLAPVVKSFKNIAFTVAYRYQSLRCSQLLATPHASSRNFLYTGHFIKSGDTIEIGTHVDAALIMHELDIVNPNQQMLVTSEICVHGTTYSKGSILLTSEADDDMPEFGIIVSIIVNSNSMLLLYDKLQCVTFHFHLNSYEVETSRPNERGAVIVNNLLHPHPLSLFSVNGARLVVLLHHRRNEFY